MNRFPVDFAALAKSGGNSAGGGYPYQLKGSDLMKDFVFAALDTADALAEIVTGEGGHAQRRLKIDPGTNNNQILYWDDSTLRYVPLQSPPSGGTYVLGSVDGTMQWLATEDCN